MGLPGGWELVIIALFVLIFFGAKRLPEMAKGLGKGIREFKGALNGLNDDVEKSGKKDTDSDEKKPESENN
jgi:sec-independent protein translocase protein TatA